MREAVDKTKDCSDWDVDAFFSNGKLSRARLAYEEHAVQTRFSGSLGPRDVPMEDNQCMRSRWNLTFHIGSTSDPSTKSL